MYMNLKTLCARCHLTNIVTIPFLFVLIILIHRLILIKYLPFSGDEAYHWEWSRHLALSYYDHPPMTAWLISLLTSVLGTSRFTIRLTAFICYTGSLLFIYRLGNEFGGKKTGILSIFIFLSPNP